jgi:hypothetical protein
MSDEPNPYAPPRAKPRRKRRGKPSREAPGEWVKWGYGGLAAVNATACFALVLGFVTDRELQQLLITMLEGPLLWVMLSLALVWCYYAWSGIPHDLRVGVTPSSAVVRFFIPVYSLYWVIAVNTQLGDALNALLTRLHDRRRAPKTLAIVATIVYFVPVVMMFTDAKGWAFVVQIADHALWLAYMVQCDELRRAVLAAVDADGRLLDTDD